MGCLCCDHCGFEPVDPEVCPDCAGTNGACETCGGGGEVYYDGQGAETGCQNCGFPGHVSCDGETCYWRDESWDEGWAHCNDLKCEDCAEAWARETWFDRLVDFAEVSE